MQIKNSPQYVAFCIFNTIFMIFLSIIMLYPIIYVFVASVSDSTELMKHTGLLLKPLDFNLAAYKNVFKNPMILKGYCNTLQILVLGLTISMVITTLGAYVLSKNELPGKNAMMFFVVFTMFFSGGLIPTYLAVRSYGIYNTIWALVLPGAVNTYNLIVMRTSFQALPRDIEEAAVIDGAGELMILIRIILPLSLPVVSVIILFYAVGIWNSWFGAMIYLKDRIKFPLQLILREILIQGDTSNMTQSVGDFERNSVSESVKYAIIIVSTLPIMLIYPFIQKNFVKGVMIGAIKG